MNKKKTKKQWLKIIISLSLVGFLLASACTTIGLLLSSQKADGHANGTPSLEIKDEIKRSQSNNLERFGNQVVETVDENVDRDVNQKYYETDLLTKYESKGFRYPSWDYNYEEGDNRYLDLGNNQKLDMMTEVYNERVTYQNDQNQSITTKYSDSNFIRSEIKNNQLKIHPAGPLIYKKQISETEKAVEKYFSIPSSVTGQTSLGLYVAPGEVATLTFTKKTYDLMKEQSINNFEIFINSSYWDNKQPGDSGQIAKRYPFIQTTFRININNNDLEYDESTGLYSYKFGTPFGGSVAVVVNSKIKSSTYNDLYKSYDNYNFSVKGCLNTLSYFHGITTTDDWNNQVNKVKNNQMTAPNFALDFSYGSSDIAFTDEYSIAGVDLSLFPDIKKIVQKWSDFLFISEYFASRDISESVAKVSFRFNDDIWGGVAAWGGGNILYCPLDWAKNAFLSNREWTITDNWGTLHEINHSFQQNDAIWIRNSHAETNMVTMAGLAILNDVGRWRNPFNITAEYAKNYENWNGHIAYGSTGWVRLSNMYSNIDSIKVRNYNIGDSEYEIYNLILNAFGPYNYMNYIRNDIATDNGTDSNGDKKEGGFYEIVELSDYFQLNFWPALENYRSIWYDYKNNWSSDHQWPVNYENATAWQKSEIDRLSSYKAFDFIANLYAAGSYMYDNKSDQYIYTGDSQPAYSIPAARPYTFDFENGINWLQNNEQYQFSWTDLEVPAKTKLGATLKVDPENPKKIIYEPLPNTIDQEDEFDIAIIPDDFKGKPDNYVSKYKWKIKIKQVINAPVVSIYDTNKPIWTDSGKQNLDKTIEYMKKNKDQIVYENVDNLEQGMFIPYHVITNEDAFGAKIQFNFVAPETGTYTFKTQLQNRGVIYDDVNMTNEVFKYQYSYYNRNEILDIEKQYHLQKGEVIPFTAFINGGSTYIGDGVFYALPSFKIIPYLDGERINLMENVYDPYVNDIFADPSQIVSNDKYQHTNRNVDYNLFQTSLFGLNVSREMDYIDKSKYTFYSDDQNISEANRKNIDLYLKDYDLKYLEQWLSGPNVPITFEANFNELTEISTIKFYHRNNNHWDARPTKMIIKDENDQILFDGVYGAQRNDRGSSSSVFVFDQPVKVEKLKFTFENKYHSGIIFDSIEFSQTPSLPINKIYSIRSNEFYPYGNWKFINNTTGENISNVNATSIKSTTDGDSLIFDIYAQGFDIVGQKNNNNGIFDIYINDELIDTVDTSSSQRDDNSILFSYTSNELKNLKVKIVNRSSKPIYLNFLQTYGKNVYMGNNYLN